MTGDPRTDIWNLLLVHPLLSVMVFAYDLLFHDFGLAVIAVTVALRLLFYPLYLSQIRSQRAMQEVAPVMKALQEKHKGDKQRIAEEQMKLYREYGVNPIGGCLPLVLQLPILYAMYAAFQQALVLKGEALSSVLLPFVSVPVAPDQTLDLTAHWLPWISCETAHGLACPDQWILPILAAGTQLIASLMAQPRTRPADQDQQAKMMQTMVYYFPVITFVFARQFPAGLAVYWITTTLFQIVQQYFVSGWGQLPSFGYRDIRPFAFLQGVPSPADRRMRRDERQVRAEVEADLRAVPATTTDEEAERRSRRRRRRR